MGPSKAFLAIKTVLRGAEVRASACQRHLSLERMRIRLSYIISGPIVHKFFAYLELILPCPIPCPLQDDDNVLELLRVSLESRVDPSIESLTKCTGCDKCGEGIL